MKKTFANRSLSLLAGFFLFGILLLTASRAEAQTYNWKTPLDAQQSLLQAMTVQRTNMASLPAGPALDNATAHFYYYQSISEKLNEGMFVEKASQVSLEIFRDPSSKGTDNFGPVDLGVYLTKADKNSLFLDAINGKIVVN